MGRRRIGRPYIMGYAALSRPRLAVGYRYIAILQVMLTVILVLSLRCGRNVAQLRSANRPMTPHHLTAMPRDLALLKGCLLPNANRSAWPACSPFAVPRKSS